MQFARMAGAAAAAACFFTLFSSPPVLAQQSTVVLRFYNPGLAVVDIFRVLPNGGEEFIGSVRGESWSAPTPAQVGQPWVYRMNPSANMGTQIEGRYVTTDAPMQIDSLPSFLPAASDEGHEGAFARFGGWVAREVAGLNDEWEQYDPTFYCPGGEIMYRMREWDSSSMRALPVDSMETDIRNQCSPPSGLPQYDEDWWYEHARKPDACSGPVGDWMSRWGANYEFLNDACIVHDMCYRSDLTQGECDANFAANMDRLCANPGLSDWVSKGVCDRVEEFVRIAFRHPDFERAFENGQKILRSHVRPTFIVFASHSGMCLEFGGVGLIQTACDGGLQQLWEVEPARAQSGLIRSAHSQQCVGVPRGESQPRPVSCKESDTHRVWRLEPLTGRESWIVSTDSGKCLTVEDGSLEEGAELKVDECDYSGGTGVFYVMTRGNQ